MTHPVDPSRPGPPTVAEIAALTARLREISARGRDVYPTERARFLADKDALIARITHADADAGAPAGESHRDPLSCLQPSGPGPVDEQERREQLTRWYAEDHADTDADGTALVRGEDQ